MAICECHCQHEKAKEHNFWDRDSSLLPLWVPGTKLTLSRFVPEVLFTHGAVLPVLDINSFKMTLSAFREKQQAQEILHLESPLLRKAGQGCLGLLQSPPGTTVSPRGAMLPFSLCLGILMP